MGTALSEWNVPTWPAYLLIPITLAFLCMAMLMDFTKIKSLTMNKQKKEGTQSADSAVGGW